MEFEQLRARARDSVEKHGGLDPAAFEKLIRLLRYVDGDYNEPATFQAIRKELGAGTAARPLPGNPADAVRTVVDQLAKSALHKGAA